MVHGGIDGHTRVITFMRASDNNCASTVAEVFLKAHRGAGSILQGRSMHNQRVERFWVDLWNGVASLFHSFFSSMETEGPNDETPVLDVNNAAQMWALHYVFLPRIS